MSRGAACSNDGLPPHVTIKATSRDGLHEETLVLPFEIMTIKLKMETVDDLLKHVRKSIRAVSEADVELELERNGGGLLHEKDLLAEVVRDGDKLLVLRSHTAPRGSVGRLYAVRKAPTNQELKGK